MVPKLQPVDPPALTSADATAAAGPYSTISGSDFSAEDIALALPLEAAEGSAIAAVEQIDTLPVTVGIVSRSGGTIVVAKGREGEPVLDMPGLSEGKDPPRAVVRVTARASSEDALAPGEASFSVGADFRKDRESSGTEVDNGDNFIQRGLASDPGQFKIEVDRGRPACKIMGSEGSVEGKADRKVSSGRWYRVRCSRSEDTVTLDLIEFAPYGRVVDSSAQAKGRMGSVTWPQQETPPSSTAALRGGSLLPTAR